MLRLLKQIESISSCRDRDLLGASVVAAIHDLLLPCRVALMRFVATPGGPATATVVQVNEDGLCLFGEAGAEATAIELLDSQPLLRQAYGDGRPAVEAKETGFTCVYPLRAVHGSRPTGFLRLDMQRAPNDEKREAVERFLHFYCNYLNLLDYSELDSLTGLLNRKTFDEAFDRILARSSGQENNRPGGKERRSSNGCMYRHWLAVVDIDHFKRVNDNFGHLFGDEVLLRIANLMRSVFRTEDRLFRFGGEEFVVMLRVTSREHARNALERFRHEVEGHEFPQVGQVTCSIGFTAVDPQLAPTDILGQADEALYYAKEHGRNRVCCFESLIETGRLAHHVMEAQQSEIDIDALFG